MTRYPEQTARPAPRFYSVRFRLARWRGGWPARTNLRRTVGLGAILTLCLLPLGARAAGFIEGTDDIPLMDGLTPLPKRGLNFSSTEGRIVDAYAEGGIDMSAVLNFYAESLPQLGWKSESPGHFRREREILVLDFAREGTNTVVHFALRAEGAPEP